MRSPFVLLQYALPQHLISRVVMGFTRLRWKPAKNALIRAFMRGYRPDLSDARIADPLAFASFNAFFTRELKDGARPLAGDALTLISPVDGTLSQAGAIDNNRLLQAKGHHYTLEALLAGAAPQWAATFRDGSFATIYLAPYNYHRIHMPADGTLREAWYVPGKLFSVNAVTAAQVPGLFARNERIVLLFDGVAGPFAMVFVGALNVGSMATVWHGDVAPRRPRRVTALPLSQAMQLAMSRGAEAGRFNMGSTVILLFPPERAQFDAALTPGVRLRMGEAIGRLLPSPSP
ncbi:MAG: archaetidylserine decarboxylase [Nevskiaceae bacterium]|jgi:phosphatidylserine decarboxylase|nr:archaetidylserine decarboxylase [Nevskiaceae bacterium]